MGIMKMRKFFICFILLFTCHVRSTIVYVHLGASIPPYIYVALEQARLFNPDTAICLIANQQAINQSRYDFREKCLETIACESFVPTKEHQMFNQKCYHSESVLDGFWRKAIERFFYIHEYIASKDLKEIVHLESDNMLYVNISMLKNAFSEYKGIGAVFDWDNRCIPSFVYIANEAAIYSLVRFLSAHAHEDRFDMELLALYKKESSPDKIDNLPLIMSEYTNEYALINALNQKPVNPSTYSQNSGLFNSIFDGAAIGQYLGGIDPIHEISKPGFINETCVFNPSQLLFEWRKDEQGRKVPFALCGGVAYRINNLHIHSKRLHDFRS
jgi:hypothetical protein